MKIKLFSLQFYFFGKYILTYVTGFFRHSNNAERNTVSLIKNSYLKLIILILMSRSKKVASALLPFCLHNSNSSGYISVKLLSYFPALLIAFKSSIKQKTLHFQSLSNPLTENLLPICSHNSIKTGWLRMEQGQNPQVS